MNVSADYSFYLFPFLLHTALHLLIGLSTADFLSVHFFNSKVFQLCPRSTTKRLGFLTLDEMRLKNIDFGFVMVKVCLVKIVDKNGAITMKTHLAH